MKEKIDKILPKVIFFNAILLLLVVNITLIYIALFIIERILAGEYPPEAILCSISCLAFELILNIIFFLLYKQILSVFLEE